jgi:hypothetical protein
MLPLPQIVLEFSPTTNPGRSEICAKDLLGRRNGAGQTLHHMATAPLGR